MRNHAIIVSFNNRAHVAIIVYKKKFKECIIQRNTYIKKERYGYHSVNKAECAVLVPGVKDFTSVFNYSTRSCCNSQ